MTHMCFDEVSVRIYYCLKEKSKINQFARILGSARVGHYPSVCLTLVNNNGHVGGRAEGKLKGGKNKRERMMINRRKEEFRTKGRTKTGGEIESEG